MRLRFTSVLLALALAGIALGIAARSPLGADYPGPPCSGCDYAGPPMTALIHGDLHGFFATQPYVGSLSLVARAPFAALARLGRDSLLWEYRLGLIPCLLALVVLALQLSSRMRAARQRRVPRAVVVGLCFVGPMTFRAIQWGHPEELLGGALCVLAILAAARQRGILAGLLLGAAVATKQWALLAIAPTLVALPHDRLRATATAALTAAVLTIPMLIGDPARFLAQTHAAGLAWGGVTPTNIWWAFGRQTGTLADTAGTVSLYAIPHGLAALTHPLVMLVAAAITFRYVRNRRGRQPEDALQLLALLFLIRCLLDPFTISYHHAPFVLALLAFEATRRRGLPLVSLYAAVGLWSMSKFVAPALDPGLLYRAYVAWALPLTGYLLLSVLSPRLLHSLSSVCRLPASLRPIAAQG